jgi:hypothetical protein
MTDELYRGLGIAGPMDGLQVESRFPGGVLFVSKPDNKAWLYDFYPESERFILRPVGYDAFWDEMTTEQKVEVLQQTVFSGMDGMRELDYDARMHAAESSNTEVRALPDNYRGVI